MLLDNFSLQLLPVRKISVLKVVSKLYRCGTNGLEYVKNGYPQVLLLTKKLCERTLQDISEIEAPTHVFLQRYILAS